jgi:hypothetical protein
MQRNSGMTTLGCAQITSGHPASGITATGAAVAGCIAPAVTGAAAASATISTVRARFSTPCYGAGCNAS